MMKLSVIKVCCAFFFTLFVCNLHAQEINADRIQPKLKKNAVYGTLGGFPALPFYGSYSVNVERELWNTDGFLKSIRVQLGGGEWVSSDFGGSDKGNHLTGTMNILTGARTFHGEANFGAIYLYSKTGQEKYIYPAVRLGIRIQEPGESLGSHFLFRAGVGFPELIYIGFGFAF